MFKNIQKLIKEFSETLDTISDCFDNDQKITRAEAVRIRKQWEDLKGQEKHLCLPASLASSTSPTRRVKRGINYGTI